MESPRCASSSSMSQVSRHAPFFQVSTTFMATAYACSAPVSSAIDIAK